MTNPTHDELERLILRYEDLDGGDRARADAHLAGCATCRDLLSALQRAERDARPHGSLPPLDDPRLVGMDPTLRREAGASLARLLAGTGAAPASPGPARVLRMHSRWRRAGFLVPAAAAVIAVVFWPRAAHEPVLRPGARVVAASQYRGEGVAGLRTGDDFVLEFELARPAHVAIVHVDPAGRAFLLFPDRAALSPALPAGHHHVPADTAAVQWRFETPAGRETFLIAAAERRLPPAETLITALAGLPAAPREVRVRSVQELLEGRVGIVQTIEVEHQP